MVFYSAPGRVLEFQTIRREIPCTHIATTGVSLWLHGVLPSHSSAVNRMIRGLKSWKISV